MKNLILSVLFTALLISCASKHPGNFGKPIGDKKAINIVVSGKTVDSKLDSPFQQIELTVENTSADWVRISRAEVVNDDPGKSKVSVVVGNDLVSWTEAKQYEQTLKDQNESMAAAGIAAAGAAVAIGGAKGRNAGATSAGLATMLGAAAVSDAKAISKYQSDTERAMKVPGHHLYTPFAVPGKMFIRKWLLMNKPVGGMIDNLVVEFETVEGVKESYVIKI